MAEDKNNNNRNFIILIALIILIYYFKMQGEGEMIGPADAIKNLLNISSWGVN